MGAKPAKIRQVFRHKPAREEPTAAGADGKSKAKSKTRMRLPSLLNIKRLTNSREIEDEMMLLLPIHHEPPKSTTKSPTDAASKPYQGELARLRRDWLDSLSTLRHAIDQMERDHETRLKKCTNRLNTHQSETQLQGAMEEIRLRNALVSERFRNCTDYLDSFIAHSNSSHPFAVAVEGGMGDNGRRAAEDSSLLRQLLTKTAGRQLKRNQLSDATDSLHQLITATGGHLTEGEFHLLREVYSRKLVASWDFYQRMMGVVGSGADGAAMGEPWATVVEDLRAECAEAYDLVTKVKAVEKRRGGRPHSTSLSTLQPLLLATICALWLQLTPKSHDEFEDVKELLVDSLKKCVRQYTTTTSAGGHATMGTLAGEGDEIEHSLRGLLAKYPALMKIRRVRKLFDRVVE